MNEGIIVIVVSVMTYFVMLFAFFYAKRRTVHISIMSAVIVYDIAMPIYLISRRDWYTRLIERGDILTFGVWMHFMPVIILYVLYVFQVIAARNILSDANNQLARDDHHAQARGILMIRGIVIFTGALMYDPEFLL